MATLADIFYLKEHQKHAFSLTHTHLHINQITYTQTEDNSAHRVPIVRHSHTATQQLSIKNKPSFDWVKDGMGSVVKPKNQRCGAFFDRLESIKIENERKKAIRWKHCNQWNQLINLKKNVLCCHMIWIANSDEKSQNNIISSTSKSLRFTSSKS